MTLRDYCKLHKNNEVEVWDEQIDIKAPYYNCEGDNCYSNTEKDHYLFLMENWFLSLPVSSSNDESCCVDLFSKIEQYWEDFLYDMKKHEMDYFFLNDPDAAENSDAIADYVEDLFTALSQGVYSIAFDFCILMGLEDKHLSDLACRVENKDIQVIAVDHLPDSDQIYFYEIPDLTWDASQGTGNLVYYYYYVPALDIVFCDVSF